MVILVYHVDSHSIEMWGNCRLLTGSILAHELMHAWLRLDGKHLHIPLMSNHIICLHKKGLLTPDFADYACS